MKFNIGDVVRIKGSVINLVVLGTRHKPLQNSELIAPEGQTLVAFMRPEGLLIQCVPESILAKVKA